MAARGLLEARAPFRIESPRYQLPRRFYCSSRGSSTTSSQRMLLLFPAFRSVQCAGMENVPTRAEVDSTNVRDSDFVDWVNKSAPGPMGEVDPVTVFRGIVAERVARLAKSSAKQQPGDVDTIQSTTPPPFFVGSRWPGDYVPAIAVALVFLVSAAVSYLLRSKSGNKKERWHAFGDRKDDSDGPTDERHTLVKDTIKAPESILTAMTIGAASVGKPKGHTGSSHDTLYATNGNSVDAQWPQLGAGSKPLVNIDGVTDTQTEWHQEPSLGQVSYMPDNQAGLGSLKALSSEVDVTEGPWFSQAAYNGDDLQLKSSTQSTSVIQKLECESIHTQRQELLLQPEDPVEQVVEVRYETLFNNNAPFAKSQAALGVIEQPQTAIQNAEEPQTVIQGIQDFRTNGYPVWMQQGSPADAALQSSGEDSRVENTRALEAALPALAIGVGTMGTVFGVAGGLQVVGFAALASILSQDFFWAESREELWQEVKGITDRKKLLDFLARRNIVKKNVEQPSL